HSERERGGGRERGREAGPAVLWGTPSGAPLNRGLERALEEAAHSGGLNLSGRKLKEFPRSAAALSHDLSDTVRAGEARRGTGPGVCGSQPTFESIL
uniref:Uncharacterized protein n=1 Tax=Accipiter nisus TaxID=211598 RepID=A0A8B9NKK1_9AVES